MRDLSGELLSACRSNRDIFSINNLINQGADFTATNDQGRTSLHLACQFNHTRLIFFLLSQYHQAGIAIPDDLTGHPMVYSIKYLTNFESNNKVIKVFQKLFNNGFNFDNLGFNQVAILRSTILGGYNASNFGLADDRLILVLREFFSQFPLQINNQFRINFLSIDQYKTMVLDKNNTNPVDVALRSYFQGDKGWFGVRSKDLQILYQANLKSSSEAPELPVTEESLWFDTPVESKKFLADFENDIFDELSRRYAAKTISKKLSRSIDRIVDMSEDVAQIIAGYLNGVEARIAHNSFLHSTDRPNSVLQPVEVANFAEERESMIIE